MGVRGWAGLGWVGGGRGQAVSVGRCFRQLPESTDPLSQPLNGSKPSNSPDNTNPVFLKWVADKPNDLSNGVLYAAKFSNQRKDEADGKWIWDVSWVELARGAPVWEGGGGLVSGLLEELSRVAADWVGLSSRWCASDQSSYDML